MEREPHPPEGGEHHNDTSETPAEPIFEQLSDEQRIQRGIADALNEERPIDDATVRRIAEQLHGEHESLLSTLAASGALPDGLERALLEAVQDLPPERDSWIDALLDYADARGEDRGPRADWAQVTGDQPTPAATSPSEQAREEAAGQRDRDQERFDWFGEAGARTGEAAQTGQTEDTPVSPEREERPHPRIYEPGLRGPAGARHR